MTGEDWTPRLQVCVPALDASSASDFRRDLEVILKENLGGGPDSPIQSSASTESTERTSSWTKTTTTNETYIDLQGLGLDKSARFRLENLLQTRARQLLTATSRLTHSTDSHDPVAIRICAATAPGDYIPLNRDQVLDILSRTPERPFLPLRVALALTRRGPDALLMEIYPVDDQLDSSSVRVGLAKAVSWAKELVGYTVCPPHERVKIHVNGPTTSWMTIPTDDQFDSLVFRKPGFAGVWIDVAYFDMREFLNLFARRWVKFIWMFD